MIIKYLFPRFRDAFFIGTLFAVSVQGHMLLNADGDIGRHITIGDYIFDNGKIPITNVFSHTLYGERLVPHEWLADLIFGRVHAWMGLDGVVLLIAVLIATTFTLTYREMQKRGTYTMFALLVAGLAAFASSLHWIARPHVFTFLFVALWTYLLANRGSKVWYFPVIMLVWANTHGGFIMGFAIWFAHMAGWAWDYLHGESNRANGIRIAIIGLLSFAVTFVNPSGLYLWDTSLKYYGNSFLVNSTIEYQSPNFHNWSTWPFLLMLAICMLGVGFKTKLKTYESFLLVGWTMLSLYSARNIPVFAIVTAPYAASVLQAILPSSTTLRKIENLIHNVEKNHKGILFPLIAVGLLLYTSMVQTGYNPANNFDPDIYPVQAVNWLETNPQNGNMFNEFTWGGYLLYRMFPRDLVFIDGQTDFYGESFTHEYAKVMMLENGWPDILTKYDVSWAIVETRRILIPTLQSELNWKIVYQDNTATILHAP